MNANIINVFERTQNSTCFWGTSDFTVPEDNYWDLDSDSSSLSSYSDEEGGDELVDKDMNKYMKAMDEELKTTDVPRTSVDQPTRKVRASFALLVALPVVGR